ncbi:hypothetical protein QAD02_017827 [Eretmocerus hayati]|uniref:Uncharacterized protein n=1 Tax=Eretmocerus hayati TaxID=131215 RepID=A0ACC2PJT3_9HYME|nr:hypothetical protein QAD02_017827 [Eretmocerus hayati]
MACSALRYPLLRNPSVRNYAAAAAAQCAPITQADVKVLDNKVTIAAVDNSAPVTQVSILFKAGSRHETYETQGIAHMLRIYAGLTTSRSSGFAITRNVQQLGGELTVSGDREYISYTLKITRDKLIPALKYLEEVATCQEFRPWEISDEIPRLRFESSTLPDHVRLVELLYKAAYREGLGYSLYCPKRHIGKIGSETLCHFVNNHFTGPRCAVVGTGISLSEVDLFASNFEIPEQDGNTKPTKYYGGEVRKERNSEIASVGIAVEGASLANMKEAVAFAVFQKVLGDGPKVKWGNVNNPLAKSVASAAGQHPFAIAALNASHTDSGVFGFLLSAPAETAGALTKAGVKYLRSPQFSDEDVARGKATLKAFVLSAGDNKSQLHENVSQQALLSGKIVSPDAIAAEIDNISAADVKNVANKVAKGKLSLAAIGNLSTVPYVDQL